MKNLFLGGRDRRKLMNDWRWLLTPLCHCNQLHQPIVLETNRIDRWFLSLDARPTRRNQWSILSCLRGARRYSYQAMGTILNRVETPVTIMIDIAIGQIFVISILLDHAELRWSSSSIIRSRSHTIVQTFRIYCEHSERDGHRSTVQVKTGKSPTDVFLSTLTLDLIFPIAFFGVFIEHQSIRTSFLIVHRCLTLMKEITVSSIGIVAIRLESKHRCQPHKRLALISYKTFTKVLFNTIPHVICFALTIDVHCPIAFVLLDGISQIVLTGKDHIFAILTNVITIAEFFVSEVSIRLRNRIDHARQCSSSVGFTLSEQKPVFSSSSTRMFPLLQVELSGQSHRFSVSLKINRSGHRSFTSISAIHWW